MNAEHSRILRRARSDDIDELARLQTEGWRSYAGQIDSAYLDQPHLFDDMRRGWVSLLGRRGPETVVVCELADRLGGVVTYGPCSDPDGADADEIIGLWVDAELRSQGMGALLLRHALQQCRRPTHVWVLATNLRGQQFYAREGAVADSWKRSYRLDGMVEVTDRRMRWIG